MCLSASVGSWILAIKYAVPIREWSRLKVPVTISRNDSFYDALSTATGNSYGYGGNSRRYENTVARDGCSARVEKSLSRGARLPQENVNICFYGGKKKKVLDVESARISIKLPSRYERSRRATQNRLCIYLFIANFASRKVKSSYIIFSSFFYRERTNNNNRIKFNFQMKEIDFTIFLLEYFVQPTESTTIK